MVDIHSHILYSVDDGAKDIDESIRLLRQAESVGYTDIVCSSHYYIGRFENKNYIENFHNLQEKIKELEIKVNIYLGNEFALDSDYFEHSKNINKINNGKYLLVELKDYVPYSSCKKFFKKLLQDGTVPILAHIERYHHLEREDFIKFKKQGVILQMNLNSATHPRSKVKSLLEQRYIDVVATDSHRYGTRDYDVEEKLKTLEEKLGKEYFNLVTEINPRKIINSEDIEKNIGEGNEFKKNNGDGSFFSRLWNKLFS